MSHITIKTAEIFLNGKRMAEFEKLDIRRNKRTGVYRVTGSLKEPLAVADLPPSAKVPGSTSQLEYGARSVPKKNRPRSGALMRGGR